MVLYILVLIYRLNINEKEERKTTQIMSVSYIIVNCSIVRTRKRKKRNEYIITKKK